VLGCGYVNDVIIDAPWVIEEEMIASLHISAVVVRLPRTKVSCRVAVSV